MNVGYIRVSKQEKNEKLQVDALREVGSSKTFIDKMTSAKFERRDLDEALA